ncbi:hypothetical protein TRFO_41822 [Tritrichomonas foetus]|uniref:Uncharacterized protein n=1 Tax=Tritrichomonas foetus TaxID=1144522 RepID=A0A1J4L036_9EUKA|nr:hypothetical protein TRFO_41822 [Tritrichomonas foetus]|eukprot:OHT16488.1 hypothetical protein TRFO_41822 [Tritrichomonas foetus]
MLHLLSLLAAFSTNFDSTNDPFGDLTLSMAKGFTYVVNYDQPYSLLLLRQWRFCVLKYSFYQPEMNQTFEKTYKWEDESSKSIIGVFSSGATGKVEISAEIPTTASFSWATYPPECELKYVQNINLMPVVLSKGNNTNNSKNPENFVLFDNSIEKNQKKDNKKTEGKNHQQKSLKASENNNNFCFFNGAGLPISFTIESNLSRSKTISFLSKNNTFQHELKAGESTFTQRQEEHSIIMINNFNFDENFEYIKILSNTSYTPLSSVKINGLLNDSKTSFVLTEGIHNKSANMMIIILGSIGGLGGFAAVLAVIVQVIKRHNRGRIPTRYETADTGSETELSRPPTPEQIQIDAYNSENSASGSDAGHYSLKELKDEFDIEDFVEGYPQNDYNPSDVVYVVPEKTLLKTVLNEVNAKS